MVRVVETTAGMKARVYIEGCMQKRYRIPTASYYVIYTICMARKFCISSLYMLHCIYTPPIRYH
jgi:hypothetical protein